MHDPEIRGMTAAVSRRGFLRVAAGGAVVLPGLLAACAAPGPPSSPTAAGAAKPASVLPAFVPLQGGPKPDYVSAGQQYEDGWDLYPAQPVKSWTKPPPGAGGTVSVFSNAYNPPSTPLEQNPAWHEVNKQLNANVQFTIVAPADYAAKMGTTMAGDDLPDVMLFPGGLNVTIAQSGTANLPQFLQSRCADLTPYLSGDGITDIIASRRPLADYDQILKEWVGNGGDQIRKELVEAMAAAGR